MYFQREGIKLRLLPYLPVGLGLPRGPVPFAAVHVHASGIGPLFLSERFLSLPLRYGPSVRPAAGSLRSCSAGSLMHVHVHVPRTGSLRPRSLGVRPVHLSAYTCREQSSAPSSCLISLRPSSLGSAGSLIGLRPRSLGVRPVHSSAFGPFQLRLPSAQFTRQVHLGPK